MRLRIACVLVPTLCGCELFYPLDGYESRERGAASDVKLLQQATAQGSDVRELVVTLPSAPARGSTLVVVAGSTHTMPTTVTGGAATWTKVSASSRHVAIAIWTAVVPAGGSDAVRVTWPGGSAPAQTTALVHLGEWAGLAQPGPSIATEGGGGPVTTGVVNVGDGTALLLAAAGTHGAPLGSAPPPFASLPTLARTDTQLAIAWAAVPSAGSYETSWTYAGPDAWDAHLVSFLRPQ